MDSSTATPAAPAQPVAETPVQSAAHAAVATGNVSDYRAARRAERVGKPLPTVPVAADATPTADGTASPATPAAPAPQLSRKQQEINDRAQRAVESATASLREENERLKRELASHQPPAAPRSEAQVTAATPAAPAPPEKKEPAYKRYLAMPDAPTLAAFDSVEEHAAAMAVFIDEKRSEERQAAQRETETASQRQRETHEAVQAFDTRVSDLQKADPGILDKIVPLAQRMGISKGPEYVVGQLALRSELGPQVFVHLHDHPEALAALVALPPTVRSMDQHITLIRERFHRLEGQLSSTASPATTVAAAPPAKTLTDAPAAQETVGRRPAEATDPKASAVKRGDTAAYRQIRRQERLTAMGR